MVGLWKPHDSAIIHPLSMYIGEHYDRVNHNVVAGCGNHKVVAGCGNHKVVAGFLMDWPRKRR